MGSSYKTKVNKLPKISRTIEMLGKRTIEVGAIQGEHAWLAGIHEYGCNIEVTPKMRAYLHRQGLHLKGSTTHIKIPERSFLRSSHDQNAEAVMKQAERALSQVLVGKMSLDQYMEMVGTNYVTMIKDLIVELDSPPNHPFTIDQKGADNPLVGGGGADSGTLVSSISYRVV